MVRVELIVEGLSAAGLDQRSNIGCDQDEIEAKETPGVRGWFIVKAKGSMVNVNEIVLCDDPSGSAHVGTEVCVEVSTKDDFVPCVQFG